MNVMYCGDQHIADGVLISALSLVKTAKEPVHIYLLTARLVTESITCEPIEPGFAERLASVLRAHQPDCTVAQVCRLKRSSSCIISILLGKSRKAVGSSRKMIGVSCALSLIHI